MTEAEMEFLLDNFSFFVFISSSYCFPSFCLFNSSIEFNIDRADLYIITQNSCVMNA